jgi:hypothetical protein
VASGTTKGKGSSNRNLEEVGAGDEHVVVGTVDDPNTNETSTFFATNVTKAKVFDLGFCIRVYMLIFVNVLLRLLTLVYVSL